MSLAVFDFDRTIVDDDSDATIIRRLREKKPPPEWEQSNYDWTPYMSDVPLIQYYRDQEPPSFTLMEYYSSSISSLSQG
ncbi:hypothetical protein EVAR_77558_1 [Eumeta japonica]|uniref:Pyridoxal phosphate phosphatase PHOSPHO2 n=1 Tax=Eumeta variegata TaxID=151549 RepID=A0A4C1T7I1_EUMVA|nr:hypothetical protein EVAR_77558_1 [Eumeta japonica]